jgi:hypothetical protein
MLAEVFGGGKWWPRFVDLRLDKALDVLLSRFSNGTVVYRYGLSLSYLQSADRMCIE